jgi:hypothetical protein
MRHARRHTIRMAMRRPMIDPVETPVKFLFSFPLTPSRDVPMNLPTRFSLQYVARRSRQLLGLAAAVALPGVVGAQTTPVKPQRAAAAAPVLSSRSGVADSLTSLGERLSRVPKLKTIDRRVAEARLAGSAAGDSTSIRKAAPLPARVPPVVRPAPKRKAPETPR